MSKKNAAIGKAVLRFLLGEKWDVATETSIRATLIAKISVAKGVNPADVKQLLDGAGLHPHSIVQWKTCNPKTELLVKLADLLAVSLDALIGRKRPNPSEFDDDLPSVVGQWLSRIQRISCYVATVRGELINQWQNDARSAVEALSRKALASERNQQLVKKKLQFAEQWAKEFKVVNMSARLRIEHGTPEGMTMFDLLERRLKWTAAVPVHGPRLAELARREAYTGIYNVVHSNFSDCFSTYPCMLPPDKQAERSLTVEYERLPSTNVNIIAKIANISWIVYYKFGEPLSRKAIDDLLR